MAAILFLKNMTFLGIIPNLHPFLSILLKRESISSYNITPFVYFLRSLEGQSI